MSLNVCPVGGTAPGPDRLVPRMARPSPPCSWLYDLSRKVIVLPRLEPRNPPRHVLLVSQVVVAEPPRQARFLGQRDVDGVDDPGHGEPAQEGRAPSSR